MRVLLTLILLWPLLAVGQAPPFLRNPFTTNSFPSGTGTGSLVGFGAANTNTGNYSVVSGGISNRAEVSTSMIAGGHNNRIVLTNSVDVGFQDGNAIVGGFLNIISGARGGVVGGMRNSILNPNNDHSDGCVVFGNGNRMWGAFNASILGGNGNQIGDGSDTSENAIVHGADCVIRDGSFNFIGCASASTIIANNSSILTGDTCEIRAGNHNFITAGLANVITNGDHSSIIGGFFSSLGGDNITLIGPNLSTGEASTIQMGTDNATKSVQDANGFRMLGSTVIAVASKTTTYTVTASDHVILCSASGGAFTVTLPAASARKGQVVHIKKTDASGNAVTVSRAGSDTIEGATTVSLGSQYSAVTLYPDGSATWMKYAPNQ